MMYELTLIDASKAMRLLDFHVEAVQLQLYGYAEVGMTGGRSDGQDSRGRYE